MDIWEATGILLRRWFVVLPIVILSFLVSINLAGRVQPEYTSSGTVVMLPPFRSATGEVVSNPFLNFGSSLQTTANLLQASMYRAEVRGKVAREGLSPNYVVSPVSRSPMINVSVTTDSGPRAVATVNRVIALLQEDLKTRQAAVKTLPQQTITTQVLSPALGASSFNSGAKRVKYMVMGIGLFLAGLAAFAVEGAMRWSARRRGRRTAVDEAIIRSQLAERPIGAEPSKVDTSR